MQETRHRAALLIAWGSWTGAALLTAAAVFGVLARPYGVAVVFLIGTAIAAGTALSRMRLAQTMAEVFRAGMLAATQEAIQVVIENGDNHDDNSRQGMGSSRD